MSVLVRRQTLFARVALALFLVFSILIRNFSSEHIEGFLSRMPYRCPLRWITGFKCAFCGMTHSWIALFKGDLVTAYRENALGVPLWILTTAFLFYAATGKGFPKVGPRIWGASLGVLVVFAIVRNFY